MVERNREQLINTIRERSEITQVVSEYVTLKKAGKTLNGLCPFHGEKTPSFTVSREKQLFYCFGCGAGGDVFNFVMRIENLTFPQAARWLAERAHIPWEDEESPDAERRRKEREAIFRLNKLAADYYHQVLLNSQQARGAQEYLKGRALDGEATTRFQLGYALPSWDGLTGLIQKKGIPLSLAEKAGLVLAGQNGFYDRFRDRVIFPIIDPQGRVVGFGGRMMGEGHPKYLNSPDTPVFSKGRYLYGLYHAKDAIRHRGQAVIVEGYTDVIQAHLHGHQEVVASLGTALTLEQVKTLRRYTDHVVIAYDADTAGQSATVRGLELVRGSGIVVKVAVLPEGDDPDSLLRRGELQRFQDALAKGDDLFQFKLNHLLKKQDITSPEEKSKAVAAILPLLAEVADQVARDEYIRMLARRLQVNEETLYYEWRSYQAALRKKSQALDNVNQNRNTITDSPAPSASSPQVPDPNDAPMERELLRGALQEIKKLKRIKEALSQQDLENSVYRSILGCLFEAHPSVTDWPPKLDELPMELRPIYAALIAENEAKNYPVDVDGCCSRIRQARIIQEIRRVQAELAAGSEIAGADLNDRLNRLNELNKILRKDFPTFSGTI